MHNEFSERAYGGINWSGRSAGSIAHATPVSYDGEFPRRKGSVRTRNKSQDDRMARSSTASLSGFES